MLSVCREIRQDILRISKESGHGHIPTSFSVIEILYAVYDTISHDPRNPSWEDRDLFVLSKGHAALGYYCLLAKSGYFDIDRVYSVGAFMSDFGGHTDRIKLPGIEVSTGSLGHGIGVSVGMALGFKLKKSNQKVITLIGDGESNEGTVWESTMVAVNLKLDNLIIIYDNNLSHSRGLQIPNPDEKFRAFGCDVTVVDGHDIGCLSTEINSKSGNVKVIVANTTKGFGCRTLIDNQYEWHRKSPNDSEFEKLMAELDEETI